MASIPLFVGKLFVGDLLVGRLTTIANEPLRAAARANLIVPRIPIRIQGIKPTGDTKRSNPADLQTAQKIDPRAVRASETVADIFGGLARTVSIIRIGNGNWLIPVRPRELDDEDNAFPNEIFFDTITLELKYKTSGGTVVVLYPQGGGGSGTVTSFSFTDANGFTGVVTNPTTTPNLTLTLDSVDGGSP